MAGSSLGHGVVDDFMLPRQMMGPTRRIAGLELLRTSLLCLASSPCSPPCQALPERVGPDKRICVRKSLTPEWALLQNKVAGNQCWVLGQHSSCPAVGWKLEGIAPFKGCFWGVGGFGLGLVWGCVRCLRLVGLV